MGESLELMQAVLDDGVDYLVCESLAERTMSILEQERQRDETAGFARDLPDRIELVAPYVFADSPQGHTRFITNAGGVNPVAAHRAVVARLRSGWQGRKILAEQLVDVPDDEARMFAELNARALFRFGI